MIGPPLFAPSCCVPPIATTNDFICVPNGTPPGALLTSNVVGASIDSIIVPPIVRPITPPIMPSVLKVSSPPIIGAPVIHTGPPMMPMPMAMSSVGATMIPPPIHQSIGIFPAPSSSRLLLQGPSMLPRPLTPTMGPVLAQSRTVISSAWCPQCACCYAFGNCCLCGPGYCNGICGPPGLNPCCDACPLDQTCRACCGCRCYC